MIRVEDVKVIPDLDWSHYSMREYLMVPKPVCEELIKGSLPIKLFSDEGGALMVAGLYRASLLSVPHFWGLLTRNFGGISYSDLRQLYRIFDEIEGTVETFIEEGNLPAEKMARLFRFCKTDSIGVIGSMTMRLYRRA